jgi:hypothetical protein
MEDTRMIRKILTALSIFLITAGTSACVSEDLPTDSSTGGTTLVATSVPDPTPTPKPTYASGTELYGMLSVTGEVIVEPKYEYLDIFYGESLARFNDHGLWGYVDENGTEVIKAQYLDALSFSEGLAAVKIDDLYGFIDSTGEYVIEPQFEGVEGTFSFGRCLIAEDGKLGIIDQVGLIIVEPQYESIELYCENYYIVQSPENKFGIIDRDGNVVVKCLYTEIYAVTDSGRFFLSGSDVEYCDLMMDFDGNQYYVDEYYPNYPLYKIHSNSIISFSADGENWGLIDLEDCIIVVEAQYDYVVRIPGESFAYTGRGNFHGLVDAYTGDTLIDCEYQDLSVEYGYVVFQDSNDKWGVMDLEGNTIFEADYQSIHCSPYGDFAVNKNGINYFINLDENILVEIPIKHVYYFIESVDCWLVSDSDLNADDIYDALMKRDGSMLIEPVNDRLYNDYYDKRGQYPNPINHSTAPFIVHQYEGEGTDRSNVLINSSGYVFDCPADNAKWFPDQGVLVVTDYEKNGLISYDGTVLFEPRECHIFTNKDSGDATGKYEYDIYNDTDYLIYTVEAK